MGRRDVRTRPFPASSAAASVDGGLRCATTSPLPPSSAAPTFAWLVRERLLLGVDGVPHRPEKQKEKSSRSGGSRVLGFKEKREREIFCGPLLLLIMWHISPFPRNSKDNIALRNLDKERTVRVIRMLLQERGKPSSDRSIPTRTNEMRDICEKIRKLLPHHAIFFDAKKEVKDKCSVGRHVAFTSLAVQAHQCPLRQLL